MEETRERNLRRLVLVFDGLLILLAMVFAVGLHGFFRQLFPVLREPPSFEHFAVLPYLTLPAFLALIALFGLHRVFERLWTRGQLIFDLLKLHVSVFLTLAVLIFLTNSVINRSLLFGFLVSTFGLLYAERATIIRWRRFQHESGQGRTRLVIVGAMGSEVSAYIEAAKKSSLPPYFVGRIAPGPETPSPQTIPMLGEIDSLDRILHQEAVDQVLFFPPLHLPGPASPALKKCEALGIPARFALSLPKPFDVPARVAELHDHYFLSYESAPKRPEAVALKHASDAVVATLLLILLAPVLLAIALAIFVTMGRPILFTQDRAGLFGRRFRMLKFRTMVIDAEEKKAEVQALNEMTGPVFKAANDPRVTRLGKVLRRTSLDELPQILHVLLGTMSFVGPRPLPTKEQQQIRGWHRRRLSMKPGITGLWQVSGRNDTDFEKWMQLDLEYVDRWSLGLDLKILLKTLPTVLSGRGAR